MKNLDDKMKSGDKRNPTISKMAGGGGQQPVNIVQLSQLYWRRHLLDTDVRIMINNANNHVDEGEPGPHCRFHRERSAIWT